ncbi:putative ribonuclease H-like domain-containing protein [Tanacetum coccineum]|uniref:Ribonuclease H-like domain-containing protein n=1 Tax=Tanacetum coccineum TaxID=301880 RepID=A0ABQ5B436_9ASTR
MEGRFTGPPSPDYIPSPEEPQSPPPPDFVPEPVYPEFMPPEDEILLAEEQCCKDPFSFIPGPSSGIRALRNSEQEEQIKPVIHLLPTDLNMSETQDDNPPPPPPPATQQTPTQQTPHTVSTIKLPILKKGELNNMGMKMESIPGSYRLSNLGDDRRKECGKPSNPDLVEMMIKKMQKYIFEAQFEGFTVSNKMGFSKAMRDSKVLSQSARGSWSRCNLLERCKSEISTIFLLLGYKFPSIMRTDQEWTVQFLMTATTNLGESLEYDVNRLYCIIFQLAKCSSFVSENTSSTNEVSTAHGVSNTSGHYSKHEQTSSYSLLASQSSCPQLDHEDLDQVDEYDLEEMDLKWQVAMISMRIKKFYKKTGRKLQFDAKEPVGFDKTKVECYNCHKTGHFARECRTKEDNRRRDGWNSGNKDGNRTGKKEESKAMVTVDGECVDWTAHSEDDENFAFMASNSSDTQVCSNECKESYANLKRLYDAQREQLSDASVEIKAYTQGLKKVEAQLVAHQQGQLWYEQKIKFMKIDLDDKTDVLTYHKTLLAKAQKEKDDLQVIVDKWNHSSKNLGKIINDHMTASDKFGLGYGDYRYSGNLSYENEISQSVFKGNNSDFENLPLHKRLAKTCEMQAVPPPMTGNYLPSGPDIEIDDSQYTYGPRKSQPNFNVWLLPLEVSNGYIPGKGKTKNLKGTQTQSILGKAKLVSSISHSLQLLHMDLFGPTSVRSLNHKTYCLVITDDFSRFSWVFFLRTKDETSAILKDFIRQIENQLNQKVKTIRCDNGTEFKNKDVIEFCGSKGIKREYSNARTPQQNGVAERKNRTLIEAARTMLADSFLPNTFWAEAVSTACYVLNRVLVTKPHNKTPYELLTGKIPIISYIRPFGCHVTILNTIDHLGKFAGKSDEGFLVGYSLQSKAFRVYNLETKRVEENLHITFLENKPNVAGKGPTWLFDLDYLTDSMNYHPVRSENQANHHAGQQEANQNAGTEDIIDGGDSEKEDESAQDCFVLPIWPSYSSTITPALKSDDKREGPREEEQVFMDELERLKRQEKEANEEAEALRKKFETLVIQEGAAKTSSTNIFSTVSTPAKASSTNLVNTVSIPVSTASPNEGPSLSAATNPEEDDSEIPPLEDIYQHSTDGIFTSSSYDDEGAVADFTNLETVVNLSPIPTSRIHSSYPSTLILGDPTLAVQTRSKVNKSSGAHAFKISKALEDEGWVDAMQEELLQFKIQKVWILVDLPYGKKAIGTKWVYRNKKDERGVVVRNKARLVAQGHRQEEGIDYDEFSLLGRIEAIRIYLPFCLIQGFYRSSNGYEKCLPLMGKLMIVYNGYRRGTIDKTLFIKKDKHDIILVQVYVDDIIFGSTKKSWCDEFEALMKSKFQMSSKIRMFAEIQKKIDFVNVKTASTTNWRLRSLIKDEDAYEKKLIQVLKIHTDDNVADLLTKAFDVSRGLIAFRGSLRRVTDGTEALLILTLFILWLDKVSTDSAKLVPLGKVCTDIETLKKNTARGTKCKLKRFS